MHGYQDRNRRPSRSLEDVDLRGSSRLLRRPEPPGQEGTWDGELPLLTGARKLGRRREQCELCTSRLGRKKCSCCGRHVCPDCFVEVIQTCDECAENNLRVRE